MKDGDQHRRDQEKVNNNKDRQFPFGHEWLESHDVVTAIDVDGLAGNCCAQVGSQKQRRVTDFTGIHIALQWCPLGMAFQHVSQS